MDIKKLIQDVKQSVVHKSTSSKSALEKLKQIFSKNKSFRSNRVKMTQAKSSELKDKLSKQDSKKTDKKTDNFSKSIDDDPSLATSIPQPVEKIISTMRNYGWLVLAGLSTFLILIFFSYRRTDRAWSNSGIGEETIHNLAGSTGAWIADVLLYMYGLSAYILIGFCIYLIYRDQLQKAEHRRPYWAIFLGFTLIILSNCSIEYTFWHSLKVELPYAPGGLIGASISTFLTKYFGQMICAIVIFFGWAFGFKILTGYKWFDITERVGEKLEIVWNFVVDYWFTHYANDDRSKSKLANKNQVDNEEYDEGVDQDLIEDEKQIQQQKASAPVILDPSIPADIKRFEEALKEIKETHQQEEHLETVNISSLQNPTISQTSLLLPLNLLQQSVNIDTHKTVSEVETNLKKTLLDRRLMQLEIHIEVSRVEIYSLFTYYYLNAHKLPQEVEKINYAILEQLSSILNASTIRLLRSDQSELIILEVLEKENLLKPVPLTLSELIGSKEYEVITPREGCIIPIGKNGQDRFVFFDLSKIGHLLILGQGKTGKTTFLNSLLISLFYKYNDQQIRFMIINTQDQEIYHKYDKLSYLLIPVISQPKLALKALEEANVELDRRYKLQYEEHQHPIQYSTILIIIDEFADLLAYNPEETRTLISHLAQKGDLVKMHLIISSKQLDRTFLADEVLLLFPHKLMFKLPSTQHSQFLLNQEGAEILSDQSDALYQAGAKRYLERIRMPSVSSTEYDDVLNYLHQQSQNNTNNQVE